MSAPHQPEVFGDFLLIRPLSISNMAEAHLAVRLGDRSGRLSVVKRPRLGERASGEAAQAIAREADVLEKVQGAGLLHLDGAGEIAGLPYLAVEHVRGAALDLVLSHHGALPRSAACAIAYDVARALVTLHDAGYVHGDIAPSNILVDDIGEVKVIDLGLALPIGQARQALSGKPGYIAPELLHSNDVSPAQDVYALGIVMAECLLGQRLFAERTLTEAADRQEPPLDKEPLASFDMLSAALARSPDDRPTSSALVERLKGEDRDRSELAALVATSMQRPDRWSALPDASHAGLLSGRVTDVEGVARALTAPAGSDLAKAGLSAPDGAPAEAKPSRPQRAAPELPASSPHVSLSNAARIAIALSCVLALVLGFVAGRRSGRATGAHFAISESLPTNVTLSLDGEPIAPVQNEDVPIPPGKHTLEVQVGKRTARTVSFAVKAGERVVFIPIRPEKVVRPVRDNRRRP